MIPETLATHYRRFRVSERVLLTGHSHQAWPDVAEEGLLAAFADAAERVDGKWGRAFEQAERVKAGYARLLGADGLTLTANTHEAGLRFLSALDLKARPRLVTSDGEFHTLRRQLARLSEEGIDVVRVAALPVATLAERVAAEVDTSTSAVLISSVMFQTAQIVPHLGAVMEACVRHGAELLVDAYHHLNIVPFDALAMGLERAFITGGGYKYCQLGEGNCFLRVPPGCTLRPVITGWYAEFALLSGSSCEGVPYPDGPERFAGATYDPTSHYRAARVLAFFAEQALDVALLRAISQRQLGRLTAGFDALDLDPAVVDRDRWVPNESLGGFLALRTPHAAQVTAGLAERGVSVDARGDLVRLGPAPYVSDRQLDDALMALAEVVR